MRVRFFAPDDEQESSRYLRLLAGFDGFWQQFGRVSAEPPVRWAAALRTRLGRVHPELGLELEAAPDGTRTLYVLPMSGGWSPLAALCVERAPRRIPWSFDTVRPARSLADALALLRRDTGFDLAQARVRVGVGRGHLLDVVLASSDFPSSGDGPAVDAAERFVATLLGDARFEAWIGTVSVQSAPRRSSLRVVGTGSTPPLPLAVSELAPAVDAAVKGIRAGLPDQPFHRFCERAEWTLFELEEVLRTADGSAAVQPSLSATLPQPDLRTLATACPEALRCFVTGQPFSSERFSGYGERFCYLALDLRGPTDEVRARQRGELEDALDRALVPGALGCVVGAGLGSEYAYIYLALTKVDVVLGLLRDRVARFEQVRAAWLLFCDDEWCNEWVALTPASGAPPRP